MPFDPSEIDRLDDSDPVDEELSEAGEADDEIEGVPSTWDLVSGRAAAHQPGSATILDLDVAELITLVLDGVQPDGSLASLKLRSAAVAAWAAKDYMLADRLSVALTGFTLANATVEPKFQASARVKLERQRRKWLESCEATATAPRPRGRKPAPANAVRITSSDGTVLFAGLGYDEAAIAEAAARLSSLPLNELCAGFKRGPQSDDERLRLAMQALTIAQLIELGATQAAIGRVFGLSEATMSARAALGQRARSTD